MKDMRGEGQGAVAPCPPPAPPTQPSGGPWKTGPVVRLPRHNEKFNKGLGEGVWAHRPLAPFPNIFTQV